MAASKVQMCNLALGKVKADRILALTDNSEEGKFCNRSFDPLLEGMLEDYPWSFAKNRKQVSALTEAPDFEYTYQHQLPVDCLHVISEYNKYPYIVEDKKILCDSTPVQIFYTKRLTDMNKLSALFIKAFVLFLASDMAIPFLGSASISEKYAKEGQYFYAKAKFKDAQQNSRVQQANGSWADARLN